MKKNLGRIRKLALHRETLHSLDGRDLSRAEGGYLTLLGCPTAGPTLCGGVTCGPCAYTVVGEGCEQPPPQP